MLSDQYLSKICQLSGLDELHVVKTTSHAQILSGTCRNSREKIAVKLCRADAVETDERLRFTREQDLLASCRSPFVMPLRNTGQIEGHPYYTMPLAQGTLLDGLASGIPLSFKESLTCLMHILHALDDARTTAHLVAHRDIKPSNILVFSDKDGTLRYVLSDFGIALASAYHNQDLPCERKAGTPPYTAPEQEACPGDATGASDLYSLGIVFFECLTAQACVAPKAFDHWEKRRGTPQVTNASNPALTAFERALANEILDDLTAWDWRKRPACAHEVLIKLAPVLRRYRIAQPKRPSSRLSLATPTVSWAYAVLIVAATSLAGVLLTSAWILS